MHEAATAPLASAKHRGSPAHAQAQLQRLLDRGQVRVVVIVIDAQRLRGYKPRIAQELAMRAGFAAWAIGT